MLTIAETSGRIDQIMANINTLFKAQSILPQNTVFILSRSSISWLLVPGKHSIEIPLEILEKRKWCSLVPIREKCVATSVGLKWDLSKIFLKINKLFKKLINLLLQTIQPLSSVVLSAHQILTMEIKLFR